MSERAPAGGGDGGDGGGAFVEVRLHGSLRVVPLTGDRVTIGKSVENGIATRPDGRVSRLHAVLERYAAGWVVRDLDSRNGTFVNGERVWGDRPLHPGDEIRIGDTTLVLRTEPPAEAPSVTEAALRPPEVTRREHDVLVALCRPMLHGDVFTEPASIREMAAELVVSDAAVKQHLQHLYDKFGIVDRDRRRARLANESLRRGAITLAELRTGSGPPSGSP